MSHASYSLPPASAIAALGVGSSGRPASQPCHLAVNLRHLGHGRRRSEVQKRRRSPHGKKGSPWSEVSRLEAVTPFLARGNLRGSNDGGDLSLPTQSVERWYRPLALLWGHCASEQGIRACALLIAKLRPSHPPSNANDLTFSNPSHTDALGLTN